MTTKVYALPGQLGHGDVVEYVSDVQAYPASGGSMALKAAAGVPQGSMVCRSVLRLRLGVQSRTPVWDASMYDTSDILAVIDSLYLGAAWTGTDGDIMQPGATASDIDVLMGFGSRQGIISMPTPITPPADLLSVSASGYWVVDIPLHDENLPGGVLPWSSGRRLSTIASSTVGVTLGSLGLHTVGSGAFETVAAGPDGRPSTIELVHYCRPDTGARRPATQVRVFSSQPAGGVMLPEHPYLAIIGRGGSVTSGATASDTSPLGRRFSVTAAGRTIMRQESTYPESLWRGWLMSQGLGDMTVGDGRGAALFSTDALPLVVSGGKTAAPLAGPISISDAAAAGAPSRWVCLIVSTDGTTTREVCKCR